MKNSTTKQFPSLIFLLTLFVSISTAQPVMLSDSLSNILNEFVLTAQSDVVFVKSNGKLAYVSIENPSNAEPFHIGWEPEDDGWNGPAEIKFLKSSPDGTLICLAVQVSIPDNLQNGEFTIPEPIVVIVCNSTGGGARVVAVAEASSYDFSIDFTQDSRLIYGYGFLPCYPDLVSYLHYYQEDESNSISPFEIFDLQEAVRSSSFGLIDGCFISNPWSDLIASGPPLFTTIINMASLSIIFQDSKLSFPVINQWVEPDAGLVQKDGYQIIRLADGTVYKSQEEPFYILCRISKGNYIFTRNKGESIRMGEVNWLTFAEEDTSELTELMEYITLNSRIQSVDSGTGIVFTNENRLYYNEF